MRFHFAFIQSILTPNSSPVWVAIESEFGKPAIVLSKEGREKVEHSVQALRTHLKRFGDSTGQESLNKRSKKLTQKSVRFAESASPDTKSPTTPQLVHKSSMTKAILSPSRNDSPSSPSQSSSISNIATGNSGCGTLFSKLSTSSISTLPMWNSPRFQVSSPEGALPDFCQQHDLCSHITKWSKTTCGPTDACIGYLGREWPCSHRVLVTPQVTNKLETPTSLAQLISSSVNRSHSSRFLYVDSIRLAKQLASAILLFHATPMLSETWQSEDIVFYSTTSTPKRGRPKLNDPHLTVRITNTTTTTIYPPTLSETRQKKPLAYETHIRNPYTYRLGVILLELACQAPLSKLREEEDLLSGPKNASTDFEVANAISETLSTDMGIPFQKMVQKCLNCDFGSGTNLNDPGLQAAFHRDVVCELEDLENRLNRLQLGE